MEGRAETAGVVVRAYLKELRSLDVLEAIRPRLSPDAALFLSKPPLATQWVEVRLAHEPLVVLGQLRGRDQVRALAHRVAGGQLGTIMRPLLATTLKLFGGTPATLFSRLDALTSVMLRGVKFSWTPSGASAGTIGIEYPYPVDDALFATWEGILLVAFDLAETTGTIAAARPRDGGWGAEIDVSW
jgi:hypothetical protein